jgi:protein phosphatase
VGATIPAKASGGVRPSRRILRYVLAGVAALIVVIGGMVTLGAVWWSNQWYVGASDGRVTIYQGVPGTFAGIPMQRTEQVTDTEVATLPVFDAELIDRGIAADDLGDAQRIAEEMATRAAACEGLRPPAGCPTVEISP